MIVRLESITKCFPGVKALDDVTLEVHPREVHALCGENGAGKSTLMKVLSGIYPAGSYTGRILGADANELRFQSTNDARRAGIAIIHQELALMQDMTVLDNLFLGREIHKHGRVDYAAERRKAASHLEALGFSIPLDALLSDLSIGMQQRLEIARALLDEPSVLVLDEPTSSLSEEESASILRWIRKLADQGTACVYISHRMEEVFEIADRVTVLRDGKTIWTRRREDLTPDSVIAAMVDRPVSDIYAHTPEPRGNVLCQVKNLKVRKGRRVLLACEDLVVHEGEIVGLAGMMGSGRSALLRCLVGALGCADVQGTITDPAGRISSIPRHPAESLARGIFLIPEDRKLQALFLEEDIQTNATAASVSRYCRSGRIDTAAIRSATGKRMEQFGVKAPGPSAAVNTLSGGNQQKVLLCRAAEVNPRLLLLDEPTRGIDVGAKCAIYRQMEAWTRAGWGILWSSSELQELLGLSDRIYVLAGGNVTKEFKERPFEGHAIMHYAATA